MQADSAWIITNRCNRHLTRHIIFLFNRHTEHVWRVHLQFEHDQNFANQRNRINCTTHYSLCYSLTNSCIQSKYVAVCFWLCCVWCLMRAKESCVWQCHYFGASKIVTNGCASSILHIAFLCLAEMQHSATAHAIRCWSLKHVWYFQIKPKCIESLKRNSIHLISGSAYVPCHYCRMQIVLKMTFVFTAKWNILFYD